MKITIEATPSEILELFCVGGAPNGNDLVEIFRAACADGCRPVVINADEPLVEQLKAQGGQA